MATKPRSCLSVQRNNKNQEPGRPLCAGCPPTFKPPFPTPNEPPHRSSPQSVPQLENLLKGVWRTPQQEHFQKQIPQRDQKPQRSHLWHMWPISIGLLKIRPQTAHVTKICSLEWGGTQAAFLCFAQGKLHMEEFEWNSIVNLALTVYSSHYSSRKFMLVENNFQTSLSWKLIVKACPAPDQDQTASRYWRNSSQQRQRLYCLQDHPSFFHLYCVLKYEKEKLKG